MKKYIFISFISFVAMGFLACNKQNLVPTANITFWVDHDFGCGFTSVFINNEYIGDIKHWQTMQPNNCSFDSRLLVANTLRGQIDLRFTNDCASWTESFYLNNDCFIYEVN